MRIEQFLYALILLPAIASAVVGNATAGEYPWFVSLLYDDGSFRCGGSLLSPTIVLTAAHCLQRVVPSRVRIGHSTRSKTDGREVVEVSCGSVHPRYNRGPLYADIAIIRLASPAKTTSFVSINSDIGYPADSDQQGLTAIGFGRMNNSCSGNLPWRLKKVPLATSPLKPCVRSHRIVSNPETYFCAEGDDGEGTGQGDSGGPLLDSKNLQIGISSFASKCDFYRDKPDGFTRVAAFRRWIQGELMSATCADPIETGPDVC